MIKAKTKHFLGFATVLGIIVFATSCNSGTETEEAAVATADTVTEVKQETVNFLYPATLGSDWKIGDPQKILRIQELYKVVLADSNYESMLPFFADSITNVTFDNKRVKLSAADFIERVKKFRKGYKNIDEEFRSYVALRSESQNLDLVLLWINEKGTRLSGKVDSSGYQETWKFNNQGKIDYRSTFVRYDF